MTLGCPSWRHLLLAGVAALALARVRAASDLELTDDQKEQIASVLASARNGMAVIDERLVQIRAAHVKIAAYEDPKSPDPVIKSANSLELGFVARLDQNARRIRKNIDFADNQLAATDLTTTLARVAESLASIEDNIRQLQGTLANAEIARARERSATHFTAVLDAWGKAHPGVDDPTPGEIRIRIDPEQTDEVAQSELMIAAQVADVLSAAK